MSKKGWYQMYELVKYEVKGNIAYVKVNNPKAMNALSNQVLDELMSAFKEADDDNNVRVVIFTGEGKAFIAGADISEMNGMTPMDGQAYSKKGHDLANFIEDMKKPVIAAINGFALGGGCEMAMACDIRIASTAAMFGQPEVKLGIIPGYGGNLRLPRLIGKGMAKKLILTGANLKADKALEYGLVEELVEPEELMPAAEKIAGKIAAVAPMAVMTAKRVINTCYDVDIKTGSAYEVQAFTGPFSTADKAEGMDAFLNKRAPEFQGK